MKKVQFTATGGPEVLELVDVDTPEPGSGEVLVEVAAAGLNFIDTYHRSGLYPLPLPSGLGLEGAGTITAMGEGVADFAVGDQVAWTGALGSYAEQQVHSVDSLVPVPAAVSLDVAAAVMLQGLTAQYLVDDTWPLESGQRCLIHAGAGGVGLLMIQMAKARGAEVFTTVGSPSKAELAAAAGADHVIEYTQVDFGDAIEEIAGPRPLDVVYDGVGAQTFDRGLALLRRRGLMATFGNASGPVEPVSPLALSSNGSIFLTRPTLFDYISTPDELRAKAASLFAMIGDSGETGGAGLDVRISERLALAEASQAHQMLEGRSTTGKVLLIP